MTKISITLNVISSDDELLKFLREINKTKMLNSLDNEEGSMIKFEQMTFTINGE